MKTSFKSADMINSTLLQDVVDCYKRCRIVCRVCYYKKRSKEPISASNHYGCRGTKKNPPRLILIPASKLCANIGNTSDVPIMPAPKFLLTKANRSVFVFCCLFFSVSYLKRKKMVPISLVFPLGFPLFFHRLPEQSSLHLLLLCVCVQLQA